MTDFISCNDDNFKKLNEKYVFLINNCKEDEKPYVRDFAEFLIDQNLNLEENATVFEFKKFLQKVKKDEQNDKGVSNSKVRKLINSDNCYCSDSWKDAAFITFKEILEALLVSSIFVVAGLIALFVTVRG